MHPDFFFRLFGEEEFDCFCFQPAMSRPSLCSGEDLAVPSLVWMHKPFTNSWMSRLTDLWTLVGSDAGSPGTEIAFEAFADRQEFIGLPSHSGPLSESGPIWMLRWLGQPIGMIRIISRICGEDLASPTGIATFDLPALARFGDPEKRVPTWGKGFNAGNLLAWKASLALLVHGDGLTSRSAPLHWEGIRERLEEALNGKHLTEAYLCAIDAIAFLQATGRGVVSESFRANCETVLRTALKKLPALMPRRTTGSRAVREGVLR